MCIICNMPAPEGVFEAEKFLHHFELAGNNMKLAADNLKLCYDLTKRKSYDRTHKKMVKLMRDWNRLEHEREIDIIS